MKTRTFIIRATAGNAGRAKSMLHDQITVESNNLLTMRFWPAPGEEQKITTITICNADEALAFAKEVTAAAEAYVAWQDKLKAKMQPAPTAPAVPLTPDRCVDCGAAIPEDAGICDNCRVYSNVEHTDFVPEED